MENTIKELQKSIDLIRFAFSNELTSANELQKLNKFITTFNAYLLNDKDLNSVINSISSLLCDLKLIKKERTND